MSDSQFIPATIRTGGEEVAVAFEPAQFRSLSPGQGTEWEVMVLMHYEGVTLDVLEHMHLRFNGEPTLRPAEHGTEMDDESGHMIGFGFGISGDGLVESFEVVWVEDGEQSLGELPIRIIDSDSCHGTVSRATNDASRETSTAETAVAQGAPAFGLNVGTHRIALIVATVSGSIGAAFLGYQWTRSFWGVVGAAFGGALMEELFHHLIPAICPECGHRAECLLSTRDYSDRGAQRSSNVIRYECRACGYELPRRVKTKADVAEVADIGVRFANFVKGFFTIVGSLFVLLTAIFAVLGAIRGEFQTAAIGIGAMIFGMGFTLLARKLVSGFADNIRQVTPHLQKHFASVASFTPVDGVVDGIHYRAESLSHGNVELWIDLPQHQMQLSQMFFDTRVRWFDPNEAEWGAEQLQALFNLGAKTVDVGFHSDSIQVVLPQDRVTVTREFAEQAALLMLSLRRQALGESA